MSARGVERCGKGGVGEGLIGELAFEARMFCIESYSTEVEGEREERRSGATYQETNSSKTAIY